VADSEKDVESTLEVLPTLGWVTRTLGVTSARVWTLVEAGKLSQPARKNSDLLFVEDEVLALVGKIQTNGRKKKRDEGELYSCLFAHFVAKTPFHEIVIQEKVSPETVREAHKEYVAGYNNPSQGSLDTKTRATLEVLARRERIKAIELETVEVRGRNRENITNSKSSAIRAKTHEKTLELITGKR